MIENSPLPISVTCKTLNISKSSFYSHKKSFQKEVKDILLRNRIKEIALEFPKYGYRRIYYQLQRENIICNKKRILKIMHEEKIVIKQKKRNPITTQSNHGFQKPQNLIKGIDVIAINQVFVADITYIHLESEFVYLALLMDLYSRRIVGWELSRDINTQLTLSALNRAIMLRGEENVKGCIHHSDNGVQYASGLYVETLKELGMLPSMGEVGNSYDNAHAESLNKTIKNEEVWMNEYDNFEIAYFNIKEFIEEVYNKKRLHSSIGYLSPIEFEENIKK